MQELRAERVAQEVHQGLQFMNSDKMGGWHSDLGRLSGGERTLVSLALILAVRLELCACNFAMLHATHNTACTPTNWHDCTQQLDIALV